MPFSEEQMKDALQRGVNWGLLQEGNMGRAMQDSEWLSCSCNKCDDLLMYLFDQSTSSWICLTPEVDKGKCASADDINTVIARMCMWWEEEHPCIPHGYPLGMAGSENTKVAIEAFADKKVSGELLISDFLQKMHPTTRLTRSAYSINVHIPDSYKNALEVEKAHALRHFKLYIRGRESHVIKNPSQNEIENCIDLLMDDEGVHIMANGTMGVEFSERFMHTEITETISPRHSTEKRPKHLAIVHLLSPDMEIEMHTITELRRKLCDPQDEIMQAAKNKFNIEGNMKIDATILAGVVAEWCKNNDHEFRFPSKEEKANHIHIWLPDSNHDKQDCLLLSPVHLIYKKEQYRFMTEENIAYLSALEMSSTPLFPEVATPKYICFLIPSIDNSSGISIEFLRPSDIFNSANV